MQRVHQADPALPKPLARRDCRSLADHHSHPLATARHAAAGLHCGAVGRGGCADSGGAPSGTGGAWVGDGYVFDAAGWADLLNHKVCKAAGADHHERPVTGSPVQ